MPSDDHRIATLRADYLATLETVDVASLQLSQALVEATAARVSVREHLGRGSSIVGVDDVIEPSLRATLSDALGDFERVRHRAQRAFFRLEQAEGRSMTEIGRTWGISRQLVSRLVNEPD